MANNLKQIDAPQVLRSVYDVGTNCLRVCLVDGGAGEGPGVEVIIDHTTDSIRLGDGTSLFTGTTIGADVGLDVNLITTDIDIRDLDANLDNVAISDGTDEVSITDVGGKKGLDVNLITQDVDIRTLTDTEDSIAVGDGTDLLEINADGSINVSQTLSPNLEGKSAYGEVTSVTSAVETTVVSHTALAGRQTFIQRVGVSGENIATFKVKINGVTIDLKRTYFGAALNEEFTFDGENNPGILVPVGQTVIVTAEHSRSMTADFNSKIIYMEST